MLISVPQWRLQWRNKVCAWVCASVCVCACVCVCASFSIWRLLLATLIHLDKGDKDDYYNIYLEQYLAVSSYNAEDDGQLKFSSGTKMCVIDKEADG